MMILLQILVYFDILVYYELYFAPELEMEVSNLSLEGQLVFSYEYFKAVF